MGSDDPKLRLPSDVSVVLVDGDDVEEWTAAIKGWVQMVSATSMDNIDRIDGAEGLRVVEEGAAVVVGVDAEWRPGADRVAVLQMATYAHVLVIDVLSVNIDVVDDLLCNCFCDPGVVVVGYAVQGDLDKLHRTFPKAMCFTRWTSVFDVSMQLSSSQGTSGLSAVCEKVIGRPLDKSEQTSDWERRPLSPEQVAYAAMDAWVLVALQRYHTSRQGCDLFYSMGLQTLEPGTKAGIRQLTEALSLLDVDSESQVGDLRSTRPLSPSRVRARLDEAEQAWRARPISTGDDNHDGSGEGDKEQPACNAAMHHPTLRCGIHCQCSHSGSGNALALIVKIDEGNLRAPVTVLCAATERLDISRVARYMGVRKRQVKLASATECMQIWGHRPGSIPPLGFRSEKIPTLVDPSILDGRSLEFSSGDGCGGLVRLYTPALVSGITGPCTVVSVARSSALKQSDGREGSKKGRSDNSHIGSMSLPCQNIVESRNLLDGGDEGQHLCFVVDNMIGKLARWLRNLGINTEYVQDKDYNALVEAAGQGRIILTKDRTFIKMKSHTSIPWYFVRHIGAREQAREILEVFGIDVNSGDWLTRCVDCNCVDILEVEPTNVKGDVPDRVIELHDRFWRCSGCGKCFWEGKQWEGANDTIKLITVGLNRGSPYVGDAPSDPTKHIVKKGTA